MNAPPGGWPALKGAVLGALGGRQRRATTIVLSSVVLTLVWKYFGSPDFYARRLAPQGGLGLEPAAAAAVYSFLSCFVLLGVVPALMVKLVFGQSLADYGVQPGRWHYTVRLCLIFVPVFLLVAYVGSRDPAFTAEYPLNRVAGSTPGMFGLHAATYLLFYLGWEFHFRGFLQFGLKDTLGATNALLVQVMASSLLHIGKPPGETFGAIVAGILWGMMAYRTRSLAAGLIQHATLGIALDWFICYGSGM